MFDAVLRVPRLSSRVNGLVFAGRGMQLGFASQLAGFARNSVFVSPVLPKDITSLWDHSSAIESSHSSSHVISGFRYKIQVEAGTEERHTQSIEQLHATAV